MDREQIVFICHSAGGIVARYILTEHPLQFSNKSVLLVLLASPSLGSRVANCLAALATPFRHKLARELRAVSPILEDLDGRFRSLLNSGEIPNLIGTELFEHPPFHRLTIVSERSAGRYFGDPIKAANETHTSVSKPNNRRHLTHRALVSSVARLKPVPGILPSTTPTADTVVAALRDRFGYVWERGDLQGATSSHLYWPVRLRRPTLIHAAQAFTAAALQRKGVKVILAIDNLGHTDYPLQRCIDRLTQWYVRAGGALADLEAVAFDQTDAQQLFPAQMRWQAVERWLGATTWKLDQILRICKLTRAEGRQISLGELLEKRPRRLLSPPIVWSAMAALATRSKPGKIITLSGYDERPMWEAWRTWAPDDGRVPTGHLYLPDLRKATTGQDSMPVHMAEEPFAWESRIDIAKALSNSRQASGDGVFDPNSLQSWALQLCLLMPAALGASDISVVVDGQRIESVQDAATLDPAKVDGAMALALEQVLL